MNSNKYNKYILLIAKEFIITICFTIFNLHFITKIYTVVSINEVFWLGSCDAWVLGIKQILIVD